MKPRPPFVRVEGDRGGEPAVAEASLAACSDHGRLEFSRRGMRAMVMLIDAEGKQLRRPEEACMRSVEWIASRDRRIVFLAWET